MIVELFIVANALNSLTNGNGSSFNPFSPSSTSSCPTPRPCPKPSSAIYQVPLSEVSTFKDLGLLLPTEARDKQPVTPKPVTITIPEISGEQLTNWWMEATEGIPVTSLPPQAR